MIDTNDFTKELEDFLLEEEAQELEITVTGDEEQDAPMINSPQKANYFLKLVKLIDEDITSINNLCDEEIKKTVDKINKYREEQLTSLVNSKEYYSKLLRNYTEAMLGEGKKRSIKLPNGTLAISKQQPIWNYEDDAIISFLKENKIDNLYTTEVKEKLNKVDFKKIVEIGKDNAVLINGISVPGVEVVPREDKFTVK